MPKPWDVVGTTPRGEPSLGAAQKAAIYTRFKRFDADKNGVIDRSELEALLKELGECDAGNVADLDGDSDGKVTFAEFLSWFQGGDAGARAAGVLPRAPAVKQRSVPAAPEGPPPPGSERRPPPPPPPVVKKARMDLFNKISKLVKVGTDELNDQWEAQWSKILQKNAVAIYANYDADMSGYLERAELRDVCRQLVRAQHELVSRMLSTTERFKGADVDAAKVANAVTAEFEESGRIDEMLEDMFASADVDSDGRLSLEEFQRYFKTYLAPAAPAQLEKSKIDMFEKIAERVGNCPGSIFEGDGRGMDRWSKALSCNALAVLGNYDVDQDGTLSRNELVDFMQDLLEAQEELIAAQLRSHARWPSAKIERFIEDERRARNRNRGLTSQVDAMVAEYGMADGRVGIDELRAYFEHYTTPVPPQFISKARTNYCKALASALGVGAHAVSVSANMARQEWKRTLHANATGLLANYDVDMDGHLSREELGPLIADLLMAQCDVIAGALQRSGEYDATKLAEVTAKAKKAAAATDVDAAVEELLKKADEDGDGRISLPELRAYFSPALKPTMGVALTPKKERALLPPPTRPNGFGSPHSAGNVRPLPPPPARRLQLDKKK